MPRSRDLLPHEIRAHLSTEVLAQRIYYMPEVDSTNRAAGDLAREGEAEGTLVISDFQTAGRGRFDRTWTSPAGRNLLFSLILRPDMAAGAALPLTLACAMSICETLETALGDADGYAGAGVHWPNDVMIGDRKICGILSEGSTRGDRLEHVIVGIGINVNMTADEFPPDAELRRPATSCRIVSGSVHDRALLLARVLSGLESVYSEFKTGGFAVLVDRYDRRLIDRGETIDRRQNGGTLMGRVIGVTADGGLRIETANGSTVVVYENE